MMKANKLILFIFFAVIFAGCENELNIEPKQREDATNTLSTESGVTNVLTGAYALAANGNAYGGRILLYADLLGVTGSLNFSKYASLMVKSPPRPPLSSEA